MITQAVVVQAAVMLFGVSADAENSESVQTWPKPNLTMSVAILGPTSELLPPYIATRNLRGDDYLEWCLRWNRSQQAAAAQRAVPAKVIRGRTTTRRSVSSRGVRGWYWRSYGGSRDSTSRTREDVWELGGYGGGPLEIYNPFVRR